MGSTNPRQYYCRCGTHLAKDNSGRQCARCQHASRDKLIAPPEVPPAFWRTEQFADAFVARHMGRVARAYRTHPHHYPVYGPYGISQSLLGEWLGLSQAQVSRFETGPPLQYLDTLQRWAQVMRIPTELLWFPLPGLTVAADPPATDGNSGSHQSDGHTPASADSVLLAPWNHRGTVEVAMLLSGGGGRVKRRMFLALSGPALTAPAHQWLIHEPEALVSGLAGRRIAAGLVDRLPAMIAELRGMDDVAGGGDVLSLAESHFSWVADLLDQASYDDVTGRKLHVALAELGQLAGWVCHDTGHHGLAQRYYIAGLRAAHAADDRLLGAHILGSMAYQTARQGQPAVAVTLIESAVLGTRGQQIPRLLAELRIRQAYACAILKDRSACMSAICQARAHVEQPARADDPPYLYWVRPAEITSGAGDCLLQLGHADQAADLIEQGIAMFAAPFDRDRQMYLTHLTEALARPGKQRDLEAAGATGIEAINVVQSLSSARSVARIRELRQQLQPHAAVPVVREFLERAEAVVGGRA